MLPSLEHHVRTVNGISADECDGENDLLGGTGQGDVFRSMQRCFMHSFLKVGKKENRYYCKIEIQRKHIRKSSNCMCR